MNDGVLLTTTIVDQAAVPLLPSIGIQLNADESAVIPLTEQQVQAFLRAGSGAKFQRTRLVLPFGAIASLVLEQGGGSRRETIRLESAISDDRKRIGLSVGRSDPKTDINLETSIPDGQSRLIVLNRKQTTGRTAPVEGPTLLIVRPEIPSEEEELLTAPVRLR